MSVVHCPRCRDEVTVPAKASPRALVRCPLCLEEYTLREALAELPPTLIVIDGSVADEEHALVGAGAAVMEAEVGGGYEVAGGGFGGADVLDSSAPADAGVAPARPLRGKPRGKRKEKSMVFEMVKVVLGGVVGISAAIIGLWWVPLMMGFDSRDPFDLGPKVSPYAPWMVPVKLHGKPGKAKIDDKTANNGKGPPGSGTGQIKVDPNLQAAVQNQKPTPTPEPELPLIAELPGTPAPMPNPLELPSIDLNTTPKPLTTPMPVPTPPEPVSVAPPAPAEKPIPGIPEFQKSVADSTEALGKISGATGKTREEMQQLYTDMYLAAGEMGRVISYLSPSDADLYEPVQTMRTFLGSLASQSSKVSAVRAMTDIQLPQRKADEGVFLAGTVKDIKSAGALFECQIDAGKKATPTTISVICSNNPQDFCQPGDEVLIVGRLVENPKKNLPGYDGTEKRVVLYGDGLPVPKAPAPAPAP